MRPIFRAAIPQLRTGTRSFLIPFHNAARRPTLPHIRCNQRLPISSYGSPPGPKWPYLHRAFNVLVYVLAFYGVYSLYDTSSQIFMHEQYLPIYIQRVQRAIVRDVNMEDLDEALDHFLDVFQCLFSPRIGARIDNEELITFLQSTCYMAHKLGPDVASGLHSLVKAACAEIRSVKLVNKPLDSEEELDEQTTIALLQSIGGLLHKHIVIFQHYLVRHMEKYAKGIEEKLADPPRDDEQISID